LNASSQKKLPKEVGLPEGLEGGVRSPLEPMLKLLPTDMAFGRGASPFVLMLMFAVGVLLFPGVDMHGWRVFLLEGFIKSPSLVIDRVMRRGTLLIGDERRELFGGDKSPT